MRFDAHDHGVMAQPIVREVPDYARQYLIEHPEFGPPIESGASPSRCGAGAPAREPAKPVAQREAKAEPQPAQVNASQESAKTEPAAERQKNAAPGASRGTNPANNPAPKERKTDPSDNLEDSKEYELIKQAEAAIPGAMAGNWRDLRTVFEFAGITEPSKAPTASESAASEPR